MWRDSKASSSKPTPLPMEPYPPPLARQPESGRQEGGLAAPVGVPPVIEPGAKRGEGQAGQYRFDSAQASVATRARCEGLV